MTITIQSNGSKWAGESADPIEALFERLATYTLNPMFEEYGNFVFVEPDSSTVRFWGNFFDLSAVFSIDTDEPGTIRRLTDAIRANQATDAYQVAREANARAVREHEAAQARKDANRLAERRRNARATLGIKS